MIPAEILNLTDNNYPYLLKQIQNPPDRLYYKGDIELIKKPCISIVGTRKSSDYGEEMTRKIVSELSFLDICIVSGLAKGIDTIAHESALENNIPTIAVLGSGIENIYPAENRPLAEKILEKGLIISEFPDQVEPIASNFPRRNRIVSGLSIATIVIEAPEKSGALITANLALEQNREVFVVPGDIDRKNSIGILRLLQKGAAYPISSAKDMIDELKKQPHLFELNIPEKPNSNRIESHAKIISFPPEQFPTIKSRIQLSNSQKKLLDMIPFHRGINMEKLSQKCSLPINELLTGLSILEIHDLLKIRDGKYFREC